MSGFYLTFQKGTIQVRPGETILDATRRHGVRVPQTCGGKGECLTCRFDPDSGDLSEVSAAETAAADRLNGSRLSCQTTLRGDATVAFRGPLRIAETSATQPQARHAAGSFLSRFLIETADGPQLEVTPRVGRREHDRSLLIPLDEAIHASQSEMNRYLERLTRGDAERIASGELRPAPSFGSEGYSNEEFMAARRRERLLYFNLEFTNHCNLACKGCFTGFGDVENVFDTVEMKPGAKHVKPQSQPLSLDDLNGVIDQAADLGAKTVDLIGGGEPLSSPIFFQLAEHAAKRGLEIEIFTNGTLITRAVAQRLADLRVLPFVKMYSSRASVHDEMVGIRGAWEKVVGGIDNLLEAGFGGPDGLPISLESIVVRRNLADLPNMWRFSREAGMIPYFERFVGCHYDGDPGELLSPVELKALWEELWLLDRSEYGFTWPLLPLRVGYTCATNFYSLYIDFEGGIRPCSGTFIPLGNVRDTTLANVLATSPVVQDLREYERGGDSWCSGCHYYLSDRCPGCRGMAQAHGSYMADDPLCFHIPSNLTAIADPRNTPHLSKMPIAILKEFPGIHDARERLLRHPIYSVVRTIARLRSFMEAHVFAVWDFMSLAKRLQRDLTCIDLPWFPSGDPSLTRFVNEMIWIEESDKGIDGMPTSHLEMYLDAMSEVGADTSRFRHFAELMRSGTGLHRSLEDAGVPAYVRTFVDETLACAMHGSTIEVAASFLYGREDLIPEMFRRLLPLWPNGKETIPTFIHYLERHIEVDGENHGPAARRLLEKLIDGRTEEWRVAARAAERAIAARVRLWDGIEEEVMRLPELDPLPAREIETRTVEAP